MAILLLVLGGVLLMGGAEFLVRGASKLAVSAGLSPLVIGLTVVAYGTSMPETAVSVVSAYKGSSELALANVLGSNVCNVLLVLGASALIAPLIVSEQLIRLDVPVMIGITILAYLLCADGTLGFGDGLLLFTGSIVYTVFIVRKSRRENRNASETSEVSLETESEVSGKSTMAGDFGLIAIGLVLLVAGSNWFIEGAIEIARLIGVSELVIGLTIVALGTSLPEVATSIMASIRGERDIAVGNVVGSNIFNILCVLGLTGIVAPNGISVPSAALGFDFPVALAVAVSCLPIFFTGYVIARWEGFIFLGYYVAYVVYLFLAATEHDALPIFSMTMAWFVMPITVITLVVVLVRYLQQNPRAAS
ncbi:MAG: calcium/sodium antiporter [Candidatus Omnitrophica bacterium]|nr:calcium/sodium antiporter [Candidatus Omnitrophota bacterium]MCA9445470.1 calcium/sodium antiporter [Candidatus Omnitrophota bacterium]MCB9783900.1 calcium/sodium antiporter [Candidatus Omnitrophota bacterium]